VIVDSNLLVSIACFADDFLGCRGSWAELHPKDCCVKLYKGYGDRDGRWRVRPRPPKKSDPVATIPLDAISQLVEDRKYLRELIETAIVQDRIAGGDGE
jgi:hypothetical protein